MRSPLVVESPSGLAGVVGVALGPTKWETVTQGQIDKFADATGDHQWIHVDVERAKDGPFGGTIAHGYLTLSLAGRFLPDLLEVRGMSMGVNYGTGKVRFPAPVPAGSRIRATGEVLEATEVAPGTVQATTRVTIELEGAAKPACVVETISRYIA